MVGDDHGNSPIVEPRLAARRLCDELASLGKGALHETLEQAVRQPSLQTRYPAGKRAHAVSRRRHAGMHRPHDGGGYMLRTGAAGEAVAPHAADHLGPPLCERITVRPRSGLWRASIRPARRLPRCGPSAVRRSCRAAAGQRRGAGRRSGTLGRTCRRRIMLVR